MNASAQTTINPEDLPFLPHACHIRWNPNSETAIRWTKILSSGGGMVGITHYCMGMKAVNDLFRGVDPSERGHKISTIFNEFKYVEDRWPENHILRPSIEMSKGRVRLFQKKYNEAISHFKKAVVLDPSQADGYAALSDTLMEMGHKDDAYKLLKEALEKLPENRKLLLRVAEIENTNKKHSK
jgi:tetratricopeptide (TPR) repeat protein